MMDLPDYGDRYLTIKNFLELCKKLDIKDCDEHKLEFFEKRRLLLPVFRIVFSTEYVKHMGSIHHDPNNPFLRTGTFEIPDRWVSQYDLERKVKDWHSRSYRELFHFLDKRRKEFEKFVCFPSSETYRKWEKYNVVISRRPYKDFISSRATHLYAYWQAYAVYEIVKTSTLSLLIDLTNDTTFKALLNRKIPMSKVKSLSLPIGYKRRFAEIFSRGPDFDALSFYVQSKIRLDQITLIVWGDELNHMSSDTDLAIRRYQNNEKRIAKLTIRKFGLTKDRLFDFLKFLCKKYFEYEEDKMNKLAEMLKQDILHLVYLISDGYTVPIEEIMKKVGRVSIHFKDSLKVIFPDEVEEAKESALHTMKSYLESNPTIQKKYNVTDKNIEDFLSYLQNHNLVLFYQVLDQLSRDWFSGRIFAQSGRQSHIIYLSLLLEVLLKTIGRSGKDRVLKNYFSKRRMLFATLKGFFVSECWWKTLIDNWHLTEITDTTDIDNLLQSRILGSIFDSSNTEWDSLVKMFLVFGVARNLSAHEHHKLFPLDHEIYQLMLSQVVPGLWFCWKYAEKKGLI